MRYAPVFIQTTIPAPTRSCLFNLRYSQSILRYGGSNQAQIQYAHTILDTDAGSVLFNSQVNILGELQTDALYVNVLQALSAAPADPYNGVRGWIEGFDLSTAAVAVCMEEIDLIDEQSTQICIFHFHNGLGREMRDDTLGGLALWRRRLIAAGCAYLGNFTIAGVDKTGATVSW
jgi:hypothetical protein